MWNIRNLHPDDTTCSLFYSNGWRWGKNRKKLYGFDQSTKPELIIQDNLITTSEQFFFIKVILSLRLPCIRSADLIYKKKPYDFFYFYLFMNGRVSRILFASIIRSFIGRCFILEIIKGKFGSSHFSPTRGISSLMGEAGTRQSWFGGKFDGNTRQTMTFSISLDSNKTWFSLNFSLKGWKSWRFPSTLKVAKCALRLSVPNLWAMNLEFVRKLRVNLLIMRPSKFVFNS